DFSASEKKSFDELWVVQEGKKVHFKRSPGSKGAGRGPEFKETELPYRTWRRPDSGTVIVQEDGNEVRFNAERDPNNNFKVRTGQDLRYVDAAGRVMTEGYLGQVHVFRWGTFLAYAVLNLFLLALWFLGLWVLVRFQWSHALG